MFTIEQIKEWVNEHRKELVGNFFGLRTNTNIFEKARPQNGGHLVCGLLDE